MGETTFLQRTAELNTGDRAALRRAAGTMLNFADGNAYAAFYKTYPPQEYEEQAFFAECLQCLWKPDELPAALPLEQAGRGLEESGRKAFLKRITMLLDLKWGIDGYLAIKLFRLVKFVKTKGEVVDCNSLFQDLVQWNRTDRGVQRKWARAVCGTQQIADKTEEENDNAD